jgi:hypothetical protein
LQQQLEGAQSSMPVALAHEITDILQKEQQQHQQLGLLRAHRSWHAS